MNRKIIYSFFVLFFVACTSNTIYKKPDNLIPEKQMIRILTDIYIANAARNVKTKDLTLYVNYRPLIFKKYGIDSLQFHNSNLYYMSRIDDYEAIYKKVEKRLKKQFDSLEHLNREADSLRIKNKLKIKKQGLKKAKE